jgi:hypothetical protein
MRFIDALCNHKSTVFAEGDSFKVVELTEHDEDVSYLVDQGTHIYSVTHLQQHLTKVTGDEVHVREVASASEP